jgi:hypothetical protein
MSRLRLRCVASTCVDRHPSLYYMRLHLRTLVKQAVAHALRCPALCICARVPDLRWGYLPENRTSAAGAYSQRADSALASNCCFHADLNCAWLADTPPACAQSSAATCTC